MPFDLTISEQRERDQAENKFRAEEANHAKDIAITHVKAITERGVQFLIEQFTKQENYQLEQLEDIWNQYNQIRQTISAQRNEEMQKRINTFAKGMDKKIEVKDKNIECVKHTLQETKEALSNLKMQLQPEMICLELMKLIKQNQDMVEILEQLNIDPHDGSIIKAAVSGDLQKLKELIDNGANINAVDMQLETPLHKACAVNDIKMVCFLIDAGCDATKKNIKGKSALQLTTNPLISWLINKYQNQLGLHNAPINSALTKNSQMYFSRNRYSDQVSENEITLNANTKLM